MRGENLKSLMMRQYICMDIYFSVIAFGEEIGVCREELVQTCGEINGLSEHIGNLEKTMKYVQSILQGVILLRDSAAGRKYSDILVKAQSYIQEHYMEDDMSLNRLASYVNMSPSYFSSIFSQESGQTFAEYLTEVRMEKAKELLCVQIRKYLRLSTRSVIRTPITLITYLKNAKLFTQGIQKPGKRVVL